MNWASEWINNNHRVNKPNLDWIDAYTKADGTEVAGHFRTEANETVIDNLGTDVDQDGIVGFFDADMDGDGITESIDLNGDGITDALEGLADFWG